ncbi:zinc-binding dehydrogenase [Mycolicibacterium vaccae]|uniref:zinc-binding dehydrogenase n=1 Tax=Mycolicibacterium vaccae TaxID=1810 RepID=UPI003D0330D3
MRAVVFDPRSPLNIGFGDVPEPEPAADEAVIEVRAIALNLGEIHMISQAGGSSAVPGWDAAGVVTQAAADGSGPPVGARVVSFAWTGGWAQRRAAAVDDIAVLPDAVDFAEAAALPVAGAAALQALRALGPVIGERVLVTGASGGVGRFAVQLAARAGAYVIAAVGNPARGEGLRELGADEVVVGLDGISEPVHGVLDNVGGPLLAQAFALVGDGGSVQSIGNASGLPTAIDFDTARLQSVRKRLEPFRARPPLHRDLTYLLALLERGELDPQIGLRDAWDEIGAVAGALLNRQVAGKAVLDVA